MEAAITGTPSTDSNRSGRDRDEIWWLFRQLPAAAWITDRDLRITEIIGYVEKSLGASNEKLLGRSVTELAATRDLTDRATEAHVMALAGTSSSFRYPLHGRWYEVHVEPLRRVDDVVGCIGAAVDITTRVELEEHQAANEALAAARLRRTISLMEATLESTADGILVIDRAGQVVACNNQFLSLWHVPPEVSKHGEDADLLGFVIRQLRDPGGFMARVRELYAAPDREDFDKLEFLDGRVFERYSRPQRVDGEIVGRVWSFRDVSERERLLRDATLLADVSRLVGSLDAIPALESVARLLLRWWDACVFELFADGSRVVVERDPAHPIAPGPSSATRVVHTEARTVGERVELQTALRAAGHVIGRLLVIGIPHPRHRVTNLDLLEEIAGRCAVAVENSRLYRAARDEVRAREEFLAVASHEVRGPVASIRLAVDALRSGIGTSEKVVDIIDREEHRLERLVDELLEVGRLQSGNLHLALESVDLVEVVHDVATRLATETKRAGCTVSIRGDIEILGQWDRLRLEQIVTNLLGNAIKFGDGKPIEIELSRRAARAFLTVTDHGIGIPADKLDSIFERFERVVPARRYGGLGLGLYIVRAIVTRLGGTVTVHSTLGAGSTFAVELPLEATP